MHHWGCFDEPGEFVVCDVVFWAPRCELEGGDLNINATSPAITRIAAIAMAKVRKPSFLGSLRSMRAPKVNRLPNSPSGSGFPDQPSGKIAGMPYDTAP